LIDVPNLNPRSKKFWNNVLRQLVLGRDGILPEHMAKGEKKWLFAYFPLSMCYRVFVFSAIIVWVGAKSLILGVLAGIFVLSTFVVLPLWRTFGEILASASSFGRKRRSWLAVGGILAGVFLLVGVFPMPHNTLVHGVVWLPDQARVRAKTGGFVSSVLVQNGEFVEPGRTLLILQDNTLLADRQAVQSQLERATTQRYAAMFEDAERAQKLEEEIERLRSELARAEQKIADLVIRSHVSGHLVMPRQDDLVGTYVSQGSTLGYVFEAEQIAVRAAVPEYDAALVREDTRGIAVRISDRPEEPVVAQLVRDIPAATQVLPSPALGDRGGGSLVTDPTDADGVRAAEPVVLFDLALPGKTLERAGGRAWVRFQHSAKPLATQWYRRMRQVFLQQFNPVS
jgi:putative peptide zinc metalloprotease protein